MKRICVVLLTSALACVLTRSAVGSDAAPAEGKKLNVLTSFLPVYCFTVNLAAGLADVENLLPGGVGPHDYQFSRKDAQKVARADLIVMNGLQLETWLDKLIHSASTKRPKGVVEAAAGLRSELIYELPDLPSETSAAPDLHRAVLSSGHAHEKNPNPHIWLDPSLALHAVTNILLALQKADRANAAGYAANASRYIAKLQKLDLELQQALAPVKDSAVVTYHDAFPYFARRYGLKVVGVIEPVPDIDPSPKYLSALRRVVQKNRVKVILTEPQSASKLARQIGRDLKVPVAPLDTLETGLLKPEAYEDGMRTNLRVLLQYLD